MLMRELYVYYRIRPQHRIEAGRFVAALHDALRQAHPGLAARRLVKRSDEPGNETWMETFAMPGHGIGDDLARAIELRSAPLLAWIDGTRHVEAFDADATG